MEVPPATHSRQRISGIPEFMMPRSCFAGESSVENVMLLCYDVIFFFAGQATDVKVIQSLLFGPGLTLLNEMCLLAR